MIKGKTRARTYRAIYRLLDRVSPVPFDCGRICGAACCQSDEADELGLYLLPGEEKIHDRRDGWLTWEMQSTDELDLPASWNGRVCFVRCGGPKHCRRELRPIQCRTFPLRPRILKEGEDGTDIVFREEGSELVLVRNREPLPYSCPLIEGEAELDPAFVRATYTVWKHLIRDPLIYDLTAGR